MPPLPDSPVELQQGVPHECWTCDHYNFRARPSSEGWSWAYCEHFGQWFERYAKEVLSRKKDADRLSPGVRTCPNWRGEYREPEVKASTDYIPRLIPNENRLRGSGKDTSVRKLRTRGAGRG